MSKAIPRAGVDVCILIHIYLQKILSMPYLLLAPSLPFPFLFLIPNEEQVNIQNNASIFPSASSRSEKPGELERSQVLGHIIFFLVAKVGTYL